jgi:hypothetical protein
LANSAAARSTILACRDRESSGTPLAALEAFPRLRTDHAFDPAATVRYHEAQFSRASIAEPGQDEARTMPADATPESDEIAAAAARKRALAAQLSARPVEDVLGLVDETGAGGWSEEDDRCTLSFAFDCWKVPPGPMKTERLSVELATSREEFDSLWDRTDASSVVRIRARLVEESATGSPHAELVEFLGPDDSDSELNRAAANLQEPVELTDRQFGTLTLDRMVNWYTGKSKGNGAVVALNLCVDDSGAIDGALTAARSLWKDQKGWAKRIEDYAVTELLPLKNQSWRDEGEAELSAKQFKSRMTLESVTVMPDGSFDSLHNDGGMFNGHSIQVGGNLSAGPTDADIPG